MNVGSELKCDDKHVTCMYVVNENDQVYHGVIRQWWEASNPVNKGGVLKVQ